MTAITLNGKLLAISEVKGDRVLLKRLPKEEMGETLEAGVGRAIAYGNHLVIPESDTQDHQNVMQAEVVELGVDCQTIRGYVYPGMRVICPRWKRSYLDEDGDYWLTGEDELLAVIGD